MISEQFFTVKKDNLISEIIEICKIFLDWHRDIPANKEIEFYEEYIDAYAAFEAYLISKTIHIESINFGTDRNENIRNISEFFGSINESYFHKLTLDTVEFARNKYQQRFQVGFAYEFTDGDLKRIQTLLNELRDLVANSEDFDANHKERILKRLEKLQSELHKRVSSLDKFWGLVGDAGVALGKFGKDAKPFVDRIREITQIVWNTQTRAEELPSGIKIPLLEKNTEE